MILKVLGSSSTGNCYLLENEKETLILEAGLRFDVIKRGLRFNLRKVAGCLISHEHGDHCKGAREMLSAGINIYATSGTHKGINSFLKFERSHRQIDIERKYTQLERGYTKEDILSRHAFPTNGEKIYSDTEYAQFYVGSFRVIPFDVKHDAYQPCGFLINHPETGTILFVTDTYYVPNTFRGLNNIIVEANFCQKILDERMANGESPDFLRNRIFKSHMSLATCKDLLQANDLSKVNNIVLIHLSNGNSDAKRFQKEVTEVTGKVVHIAEPGLTVNFSKQPF